MTKKGLFRDFRVKFHGFKLTIKQRGVVDFIFQVGTNHRGSRFLHAPHFFKTKRLGIEFQGEDVSNKGAYSMRSEL